MLIRSGVLRMLVLLALGAGVLAVSAPRMSYAADPLSWAPAQAKRSRGHDYTGYNGKKWKRDYGVLEGRCNREAVGAALGGVANGAVGSQSGKREPRQIAVVLDAHDGRDMDETDRACIGHALELAGDRKRVAWNGADGRTTYLLTPLRGFEQNGAHCREFDLRVATPSGRRETSRAKACPAGDGNWRFVN
jgi:surface antigen